MNNILVAYYTKSGASEEYAKIIGDTFKDNGFKIEICNLSEKIPDILDFNTIILGTGVRMFRVYRRWKKILKQKNLNNKNTFLYLSSGTAIEDPEKAVNKFLNPLIQKYNLKPLSIISFPGKIPEKWAKMDGSKETIKPELAKEWAHEIIKKIKNKK
jgi:menaquinone-dependent protoporphyrinogen IX oxidase